MKFKISQKILTGYLAGFVLLAAFAGLTLFNGKRIEATTIALSQEKIPGLIAVSALKNGLQVQTNHLYELYATNDQALFASRFQQDMTVAKTHLAALQNLPEFKKYQSILTEMSSKQTALSERFVQVMRQPEVDWDAARAVLSDFSQGADAEGAQLDEFVQSVADETLARASASQKLTEQLMNGALILTALVFLGFLAMVYFSNRQVVKPLKAVSASLVDIAVRKDLTYRIKHDSKDEFGDIADATNRLLEEFQKLARTLDGTAQELNRTTGGLTQITEVNIKDLHSTALKLKTIADNLHGQIRLLNF